MPDWVSRLLRIPWVAHLIRAQDRYALRLGSQFAGAITYFSVLSMVPILLFAFSTLGLTLTVLRPDLLDVVQDWVRLSLTGAAMSEQVNGVIVSALTNWQTTGLVGFGTVIWWGTSWIGSIKSAIRSQFQDEFDPAEGQKFIVVDMLINLLILFAFLLVFGAMAGFVGAATWLGDWIRPFLQWPGGTLLLTVLPIVVTVGIGWVLFMFMFHVLPVERSSNADIALGSLIGGISLTLLLFLTNFLMKYFSRNVTVAIFGPVITIMLFFNLFAKLVLLVAAWIATKDYVEPQTDGPEPEPTLVEVARLTPWVSGFAVGAGIVAGLVAASRFGHQRPKRDAK